jgi:XRE family aerobic/anaerobic benzoate catabolism transcriptional regulator
MSEIASFSGTAASTDPRSMADASVQALQKHLGVKVRAARERKGLSRRVLSEISGVSPRYLAQLEAGEGNISVGLLQRVAIALDHRIDWLIGPEDPWTSEVLRMAELFRSADKQVQDSVMQQLAQGSAPDGRAQRICLIGLRGAGKSTLGQAMSARLDLPFVELNREIETVGGMPLEEIMALYGQEGYRKLEADALDRVIATHDRMILAVAGGIVAEPDTYARLLDRFHTVWIRASAQEHMDRVRAQGDERPMAGNPEAMAQLRTILNSREALYARAGAQLDTSGQPLEASVEALSALIAESGLLG